jgi:sarcosine oxidase gamma subunit
MTQQANASMAESIATAPVRPGTPRARRVPGLRVVSLRWLDGDDSARQAMEGRGLPWVTAPGTLSGTDPIVAWRAPHERVLLGPSGAPLDALLGELAPGCQPDALAVDLSESAAVFSLDGPGLDDWLAHLVDASAIPRAAGRAATCRMADIAALLLRLAPDRLWLLVDVALVAYVEHWLAHAHEGAFAQMPSGQSA